MLLKTLGGLELVGVPFRQPKPLLLLAHLALEGPQPRAHLAELFWPGGESRKSLSMALTRLHQGAGDVVASDAVRVWATVDCDAKVLLQDLERGRWADAVELYTGAFLDGIYLDWHEELETWVYSTREYLAERVQYALFELAESAAQTQNFRRVRELAERAYRLPGAAPLDPSSLVRLERLLIAGESSLRTAIKRELCDYGIPTTLTLAEAQRTLIPTPKGQTLPIRATSFVGRALELAELSTHFEQGCRLVTILGGAGVGKTRLAVQFAHTQLKNPLFLDGVYFVALETFSDKAIAQQLAQQLGCVLRTQADAAVQLADFLGEMRILVVLDNFEHLLGFAPTLSQLIQHCPNLSLIVTSRSRLNLEEEHLLLLDGLSVPPLGVTPADAATYESVQLFMQRARQLRANFTLETELAGVLALCHLFEGVPLGLELTASWVSIMPCSEIAAELRSDLDAFENPRHQVPERHRNLRNAFDYSWLLLSPKEQKVLAALSVFQGGFTREAASQVVDATISILTSLVDKSLLRVSPTGRFDQHPLIAQYAREKLAGHVNLERQSRNQHANYFAQLAREQKEAQQQGRQHEALRVLETEWANIRTLIEHSLATENLGELESWLGLSEMLHDTRSSYAEALEFLGRAEATLHPTNPDSCRVLGGILVERAWFEHRLGNYQEAKDTVLRAQPLLEGAPRWQITAFNLLSILERRAGNYQEAKRVAEAGLVLAYRENKILDIARMLATVADIEEVFGNHATSEHYFLEAIALYKAHKLPLGLVRNLNNLGWLYYLDGRYDEAQKLLEEGLVHARKLNFRQNLPYLLNNLGYVALALGNLPRSQVLNEEALELARENREQAVLAEILICLSRVHLRQGQLFEAKRYLSEGLELAWCVSFITLVLQAIIVGAELMDHLGACDEAAKLILLVIQHPAATDTERNLAQELWACFSDQSRAKAENDCRRPSLQTAVSQLKHFSGQQSNHMFLTE